MNRKNFLLNTSMSLSGIMLSSTLVKAMPGLNADPDPYQINLVKEFVVAGHGKVPDPMGKLQSMLKDYPNMIYSKFDWGNGDYEDALEGAGHMGDKDIAQFLIDSGARTNIYVLCMLGKTNLVKPILEQYPKLVFAKGPHGFTLLHHAKVGGKDSEELYTYLKEKGLNDEWIKIK